MGAPSYRASPLPLAPSRRGNATAQDAVRFRRFARRHDAGCPGTGGLVPSLSASGGARAGEKLTVTVDDGLKFGSGLLLLGTDRADVPLGFGCSALVGPAPFLGPALQVFLFDSGAPGGFSASNGLVVVVP